MNSDLRRFYAELDLLFCWRHSWTASVFSVMMSKVGVFLHLLAPFDRVSSAIIVHKNWPKKSDLVRKIDNAAYNYKLCFWVPLSSVFCCMLYKAYYLSSQKGSSRIQKELYVLDSNKSSPSHLIKIVGWQVAFFYILLQCKFIYYYWKREIFGCS
jgi:hypothetical protein